MKRLTAALFATAVLGLAAAAGMASPAAASPPVGGCPNGFALISLADLANLLGATLEQIEAIPGIDTNGDLNTCYTTLSNGRVTGTDNLVPK
jgi:hypothetical protein